MSLPRGWAEVDLQEIADFVMGQAPPGADCNFEGLGTPFVKAGEFGPERPVIREWTTRPLKLASESDVLICVVGATAGKLNRGADCAIGRSVAAIRPNTATSADFLYPRMKSEVARLRGGSTGTAQGVISREMLADVAIALPPAAEQRRIVVKLDVLSARLASARAALSRVPVLAEQLRKQIVRDAFDGTLTAGWRVSSGKSKNTTDDALNEAYLRAVGSPRRKPPADIEWRPSFDVPPSWRWASIDHLVSQVQYGSSAKTSSDINGVPVLRMGNIQRGKLDWTDLKYLPRDHEEFPDLLLNEGDVLFNRTNSFELVGKTAVCKNLEHPTAFASYLIRIRPFGILAELLSAYLNSPLARSWIERVASQQVGQANVNGSKLKALGIPLPPFDEQAEILQRLNNAFARVDRLEAEAARARVLLDRLESAILTKAFKGELVPQDPNDEPASVLLDRIRAQRIAAAHAKHKPRADRRVTA